MPGDDNEWKGESVHPGAERERPQGSVQIHHPTGQNPLRVPLHVRSETPYSLEKVRIKVTNPNESIIRHFARL